MGVFDLQGNRQGLKCFVETLNLLPEALTLRVQVPNNHMPTQNLYYNYYYPKPKYLIIGYLDPLGKPQNSRFRATRPVHQPQVNMTQLGPDGRKADAVPTGTYGDVWVSDLSLFGRYTSFACI